LWKPGTAAAAIEAKHVDDLVEVPAFIINETLLLGTRVTTAAKQEQEEPIQPVLAFLDCGSTFSVVNWEAAKYLGLPPKSDKAAYDAKTNPVTMAIGVDGKPLYLPMKQVQFTVVGDPVGGDVRSGRYAPPTAAAGSGAKKWHPFQSVLAGVGDLPVFAQALSRDGTQPYQGPAVLLGLDVLAQRRIIIEGTSKLAPKQPKGALPRRRLFISPS
jgi:hypothetical protein